MRLIDAEKLRAEYLGMPNCYNGFSDSYDKAMIVDMVDEQPTIDAIPVVRCKECRFRDTFNCGMQFYGYDDDMNLRKSDDWTMDDGFCYWGEKKDV